jgi:hypothetical protein
VKFTGRVSIIYINKKPVHRCHYRVPEHWWRAAHRCPFIGRTKVDEKYYCKTHLRALHARGLVNAEEEWWQL